jgi:hypothetical protein
MEAVLEFLKLVSQMGLTAVAGTLFVLGAAVSLTVFCWATIKYVPPFVKQTTRIADNLESINKSHSSIERDTSKIPALDDKIDRVVFMSEEIKKKVDTLYHKLIT